MTTLFGPTAITAVGTVAIALTGTAAAVAILQSRGSATGLSYQVEGRPVAGGAYIQLPMYPITSGVVGSPVVTATAAGDFVTPCAGYNDVRLSVTAIDAAQTQTFSMNSSPASWPLV